MAALTDRGTGKDWEHFTLGLGYDMEERENIKLRQGDVDRLERNNCDDTREILRNVTTQNGTKEMFSLFFPKNNFL